ncbi:MAG: 30S ribosome-binding factor RbfA [Nitrospirae bacterium]|nr:30S ribosome-binding factor RbfA [Nitrospirota bacterium]
MLVVKRSERVADLIKMEIADILIKKIKDPRVGFATVTGVDVTDDLRYAKAYISVMGDEGARKKTLAGLNSASSFIRSELGRRLVMRRIPELAFKIDNSLEQAVHIFEVLDKIKRDK